MAAGATTNERTVVMKGGVTDPDGDSVFLEVEIKPVGAAFSNYPSSNCISSGMVASGGNAEVTCSGLADGQYRWQARAKDSKGAPGSWLSAGGNSEDVADIIVSAGAAFINYPPSVTVISPNGNETLSIGNSYDIKWNATDSTGIVQYIEVYLSADGGVTWQLVHTNEPNDGVYTWTPAITTTQARIKVEAIDSYGDRGRDVSDGNLTISASCTSPLVPVLYGIGTLNETGTYTVSWSSISGVTSYTLQEATNSSFTNPLEYPSLSQASKSISGKTTNTYYYRVKASNSCGSSPWSNWESIEVLINQSPYTPSNPSPADGAINVSRRPTLSWSGGDPDGTVDYAVFLGTNQGDLPAVRGFNSGTTTPSYSINYDLNPGTTYYWYIKARDNKGLTTAGPVWRFTTEYSYADLVPTNLTLTGTVAPNAQVTLNLTVKSQGTYTSPGAQAFFYLSSTSGGKEQKLQNLGTIIPQLGPGEETTISQTVTLNNLKTGQSYIDAWIDTQNYFIEGNLNNNTLSTGITYQDANSPVISSLSLQWGFFRTGYDYPIVFSVSDDIGVTALDFYYSFDNGFTWEMITTGFVPGSNGYGDAYFWTIPANAPLTSQLLIKMVAHDSSSNSAEATAGPYTIVSGAAPAVTILSPNGGETWDLGSTQTIRWSVNAPNGISSMRLTLLYADQVESIADITSNTSGSYQWTVPNWSSLVTNTAKIRIWVEDLNANLSEDYSDAPFTIRDASDPPPPPWTTPGPITTIQPGIQADRDDIRPAIATDVSGNAHLVYLFVAADDFLATPRTITHKIMYQKLIGSIWTSPTVVYSRTQTTDASMNGYRDIQDLQLVVDGNGNPHIVWTETVNGGITSFNQCEIYSMSFNGSSWDGPINVSNTSGVVSSEPKMAIDPSNNIHVVWRDGYSFNADYTISGTPNIYHRKKDNVGSWSSVSQLTTGGAVSPSVVSDTNGNLHLVYKMDIDPPGLAYMKWNGAVWSSPLVVTSGAGYYVYPSVASDRSSNLHLVWRKHDVLLDIGQIFYSYFNGIFWTTPEKVSDRVSGQDPSRPSIVSDSIDRPHIIWEETGNQYRVNYKAKNPQGWSTAIQLNLSSQGTDPGSSAATISPTDHMHVVWTSFYSGHTEVFYNHADVSVDPAAPGISLLTPTNGETLSIGSSYPITWTATDNTGVAGITLKYTTDGGTTFSPIAQGLPNAGTYNWTVPNVISNTVQIFAIASDTVGNQMTAMSGLFTISDQTAPAVILLTPNGGESLEAGSVQIISWTASDNVAVSSVDLLYSIDGGLSWVSIAEGGSNTGTYTWTIPYSLSSDCLVKIVAYDSSGRFTTDVSDGTFMIISANSPPLASHSPIPLNGEIDVSLQPVLNWTGGDTDMGDNVTYTVYFGNSSNPLIVSIGQIVTDYNPGPLTPFTTYYWMVVASDGKSSTSSPLWSFTTGPETIPAPANLAAISLSSDRISLTWTDQSTNEIGYVAERKTGLDGTYSAIAILPSDTDTYNDYGLNGNTTYVYRIKTFNASTVSQYSNEAMAVTGNAAPDTPSLPFPADATTIQPLNLILQWSGGDPDPQDNITYNVYFGSSSNPAIISSGQTETYFIPGALENNSVYYWRVVATDSNGNTSMGPLWYFVTEPLPVYSLTVAKLGTGNGVITSNPGGIECGGDCSESYNSVVMITLTASPDIGSTFAGFNGDPDCSDGVVTMDASKSCIAIFEQTYVLNVNKTGSGNGTVLALPGIDCGLDCSESYTAGISVDLTAIPDGNSLFAGWGGDCSGTTLSTNVSMDNDKTCTATFILGLLGEYYNNSDLTGFGLVRIDPLIDFDWGTGSPDPAIGQDTFSVRWAGKLQVDYNETYTFTSITDDGIRLWVDGHLILDYWKPGGVSISDKMDLTEGLHDMKVEFYEETGGALVHLYWSSPSTPYGIIPNDHLYPPDGAGSQPVLEWAGDAGYNVDGLEPQTGDTTTLFTYRVKYTNADGNPPMGGFPRVHILKGGKEVSGSPFVMSYESGDYTGGAIYEFSTTLPAGLDYTYYFDAKDTTGLQAIAMPAVPTPVAPIDAPDVSGISTNADLIVSSLSAPTTASAGTTISISDTTKNQGGAPAGTSMTRFYLSTNTIYDTTDTYLVGRSIPSLTPGVTNSGSTSVTIPAGTLPGTYYIISRADADGTVVETNENNNNRPRSITVP